MTSIVDGRVLKLRASCDACNEAKVRCSQTKPTCTRCEKNEIGCIYGLSRRSHKNAPRIGSSQEFAHLPPPYHSRSRTISLSDNVAATHNCSSSSSSSPSPSSLLRSQPNTPLPAMSPSHNQSHHPSQDRITMAPTTVPPTELMTNDSATLFSSLGQVEFPFPIEDAGYDFLDFPASNSSNSIPKNSGDNLPDFFDYPLQTEVEREESSSSSPPQSSCSCASRLIEELALMPGGSSVASKDKPVVSFDAQLSQLRRIINIAEDCVTCPCTTQDDMSIMTTSILIGRVIQCLETSLTRTTCSSPPSTSTSTLSPAPNSLPASHAAAKAPKLSLGELQIDPDEENQLKQHLWLLQFRKLRKVIAKLSVSVHQLTATASHGGNLGTGAGAGAGGGGGGGGGNSAHAMACQCIHMWLVQKTDGLKARYDAQEGERWDG